MSMHDRDNEWKPEIIWIIWSPRGITLPKIIQRKPNCVFSWHIYKCIPNFNSKCSFVMQIMSKKPIHIGIFLSPKGITLPQIIRLDQYSKSTCLFSWHIYMYNVYTEFQFNMLICDADNERKPIYIWIFSNSKGYNSAENYSTRPIFEVNVSSILVTHIHIVYIMNFNSTCQFVMQIMSGN